MSKHKNQLLREYITEAIRVTIQQVDTSGEVVGGYSKQLDVSDDDADEVQWFLDKYGRSPIEYRKSSTGKQAQSDSQKKLRKTSPDPSETSAREVISDLVALDPSGSFTVDELFGVIKPWKQAGFDALRRVQISSQRTGKSFPFFAYRDVDVGSKVPFPPDPSSATTDFLLNTRVRIGRNDTGSGELLLALLTGGVAGGPVGDLTIGEKNWEVKDARSSGAIRLGGVASDAFKKYIRDNFNSKMLPRGGDVSVLLSDLTRKEFYRTLDPGPLKDLIDAATAQAAGADELAGFVLLTGEQFEFYPVTSVRFSDVAKDGRLHVLFTAQNS